MATCKTSTITLDASKSTGEIQTYSWKKISGDTAQIKSPSDMITKIGVAKVGVYLVKLVVTDSLGRKDSAIKKITITK